MPGMIAVVLLLNGVQVHLPAPALLVHGTACVPLRTVCERQGARVTPEPDGNAVFIHTAAGPVRLSLAQTPPSPPSAAAFALQGVTYVSARALADALGGYCRWSPDARTVTLDLPWLGGPAQAASPEALAVDGLAWRGRPLTLQARHPGGMIDWLIQDIPPDLASAPLSARGRPLRVFGRVRLDARAGAVIEPFHVASDPSHPSLSVLIAPRELHPGATGLVTVKMSNHTRAWMNLGSWPPLRVRLEGPAGQAVGIALGDGPAGLGEARGLAPGAQASWTVPWQVPSGRGRQHLGAWRAIVRTPAGVPAAVGRFVVKHPPAGASSGEAR